MLAKMDTRQLIEHALERDPTSAELELANRLWSAMDALTDLEREYNKAIKALELLETVEGGEHGNHP